MRRVTEKVSMPMARERALRYLASRDRRELVKASAIADAIWSGHSMTGQGAGGAVSRVLHYLSRDAMAVWISDGEGWGWRITSKGRGVVEVTL